MPTLYAPPQRNLETAFIKTTPTQRWDGTTLEREVPREFDAVAFGETLYCEVPSGNYPTHAANNFYVTVGGGETNQVVALSYIFDLDTTVFGAVCRDSMGIHIRDTLRQAGVTIDPSRFPMYKSDDLGEVHSPFYRSNRGSGIRVAETEYCRGNTPMRRVCTAADFDFATFFRTQGAHVAIAGGIANLLSDEMHNANIQYLKLAGETGAFRVGDLNFRAALVKGVDDPTAWSHEMVDNLDMVIGNQSDYQKQTGYGLPRPIDPRANLSEVLDVFKEMLNEVHKDKKNLRLLGVQLRNAITADRIQWTAAIYDPIEDKMYVSPIFKGALGEGVDICYRVGGGDSTASGIIGSLYLGLTLQDLNDGKGIKWPDPPLIVDEDQRDFVQATRLLEDNVLMSAAVMGATNGLLTQTQDDDATRILWEQLQREVSSACEGTGAHNAR